VERDDSEAKFWLDPVLLEYNGGFGRKEINRIQGIIEEHEESLLESWHAFFHG
jgi:hypothetical protein